MDLQNKFCDCEEFCEVLDKRCEDYLNAFTLYNNNNNFTMKSDVNNNSNNNNDIILQSLQKLETLNFKTSLKFRALFVFFFSSPTICFNISRTVFAVDNLIQ